MMMMMITTMSTCTGSIESFLKNNWVHFGLSTWVKGRVTKAGLHITKWFLLWLFFTAKPCCEKVFLFHVPLVCLQTQWVLVGCVVHFDAQGHLWKIIAQHQDWFGKTNSLEAISNRLRCRDFSGWECMPRILGQRLVYADYNGVVLDFGSGSRKSLIWQCF